MKSPIDVTAEVTCSDKKRRPFRKPLWFGLLTLAACSVLFLLWLPRNEPLYKGKKISYLVDVACGSQGGKSQHDVAEIGTNAIPFLIRKLETKDTKVRRIWLQLQDRLPESLAASLPHLDDAATLRSEAADWLALLGPDSKAALPQLIEVLHDTDEVVRQNAVNAVGAIGPDAGAAVPVLKQLLAKEDIDEQVYTAWSIWAIDHDTNLILRVCGRAISQSTNDGAAMIAAMALGSLGTNATWAIPALIELLGDKARSSAARGNAALALGKVNLRSPAVLDVLKKGMNEQDTLVKADCAIALWRLDSQCAEAVVPIIVEGIVDRNKRWPSYKSDFLSLGTGFYYKSAIPILKELLNSDDPEVRQVAADALKKLEPIDLKSGK